MVYKDGTSLLSDVDPMSRYSQHNQVLRTTEAGTLTWGWNTLRSWNSVQTAERCHEVMFGLGRLQTIFFNRISLTAIDKLGPPFLTE